MAVTMPTAGRQERDATMRFHRLPMQPDN